MTTTTTEKQIILLLKSSLAEIQSRRGNYSMRQFAKKLGLDAPVLSLMMNGKRKITHNLAKQVLQGLPIDQTEANQILADLPTKSTRSVKTKIQFKELNPTQFDVISDWWYFAVLSLSETDQCRSDPKWIAKRLNITTTQAEKALEKLLELNLIKKKGTTIKATGEIFSSTQDIPSSAIKKNHQQGLELALEALHEVSVELREFGATTMIIDPKKIPEAKKMIRELRKKTMQVLESGEKLEVYRLQVQLFPLTKVHNL